MDNCTEANEQFYERFWQDVEYQQAFAFDSAVRDRFPAISEVWGGLRRPKKVLDYGCGNGVLTYWLWSNGFGEEVLGVDVSSTGVENARSSFTKPGLQFELVAELDAIEPASFDVVVSSHVLEHIDNPEVALKKITSMAEWMVIEVPLERCLWPELVSRMRRKPRRENPLGHVNFWDKEGFRRFLKQAGLIVVKDYQYASAPYSPFNHWAKRLLEIVALRAMGLKLYSKIMATHYAVLVRKINS